MNRPGPNPPPRREIDFATRIAVAIAMHPRHVVVAALACGLALCRAPEEVFLLLGAVAVLALSAAGARAHLAVLALAVFIFAGAAGQLRLASIDADPLAAASGGRALTLVGDVVSTPRERAGGGAVLRARVGAPGADRQLVEVTSFDPVPVGVSIGDGIAVRGRVAPVTTEAGSPAARSYARYLLRNGVRRRVRASEVIATGGRRGGAYGVVDAIRRKSERTIAVGLPPEVAALLRGMVLGGDAGLSEPTVEAFRAAGLSHILAVSGQNVLLLVILVQAIAMGLGLGRKWRIVVPVLLVCLYVPLCGAQASVVRAGAMGLAGLAATAASRPSSRGYALLLGAIAVLGWNPRATADVGAQLSFAAVLGIVAFARPLAARLARSPGWVAEGLAVTAGATLATAPLMAYHFGTLSLVSLAANVAAAPLIGPIVWLGSLAAAIGQFSQAAGSLLNAPNGFLLGALITLARAAAAVPGAQVAVPRFGGLSLVAASLPIVYAGLALNGLAPSLSRGLRTGKARSAPEGIASATSAGGRLWRPAGARAAPFLAIALGAAVIAWTFTPASLRLPRPSIVFLDVGQGDATLLLGASGCAALIDGGPPGRGLPGRLRRMGVGRLDLVVATHPQLDHDGGLTEIAAAGRPRPGAFLDGGGATREPRFASLRADLARLGARAAPAVEGAGWRCGDLSVELLAPRPLGPGSPPPADPNTRAAVALVTVGELTMLAAGDAESPQLLPLPLPNVDVLKVSHHGSDDPGLPTLLNRLRPAVAAIGVGRDNRYGHPTPATLRSLAAAGARVFRTDRDGTVAVSAARGDPSVATRVEAANMSDFVR